MILFQEGYFDIQVLIMLYFALELVNLALLLFIMFF